MKTPVIVIGLHAFSPALFEAWTAQGHLKNLNRLREQGAYGRLNYSESADDIQRWTSFLVGCSANDTGYRGRLKLKAGTYTIEENKIYDFAEYPPFYALGNDYQIVVHQTPLAKISEQIGGLQVLNKRSHPPELFSELKARHGKAPHYKEYSCWWERTANLDKAKKDLNIGIAYHVEVCKDLLERGQWDLFLTVIEEPHYAGHDFWHLSQLTHPLYPHMQSAQSVGDPLLATYEEADRAIGEILAKVPDNARVVVFSIDGMGANTIDLPSGLFLAELLYRFNFPGKVAIAPGNPRKKPPAPITHPKRQSWAGEIWQLKHEPNPIKRLISRWTPGKYQDKVDRFLGTAQKLGLASPYQLLKEVPSLFWQPTMWYKPLWPKMKAFALPSFSSGYVRINLRGRDPQGIVDVSEYDALCDQLTQHFYALKDGRTGQPMVEKVIRTRKDPLSCDLKLPDADLIVSWADHPTDVIDSPDFGRIGPVPFCNTGGHKPVGFFLAQGTGITPSSKLPEGHLVDLAPTILQLMDAPIPQHCEGKSLLTEKELTHPNLSKL